MAISGIKDNKCFESAIWYRGVWDFSDGIAAGATATQSFPLTSDAPDFPVVIVTSENEYDPSEIQVFGYAPMDGSSIVIGVKNNSSFALSSFSVNFVII